MKILLFGKNGQVGWELQQTLPALGELLALDRHGLENLCGDLANLKGLEETIRRVKPDVIVNAAAYTAVDKAETEKDLADVINCQAVAVMARESARLGAILLHYSSDYVFDGSGSTRWDEDSPSLEPLNYYGKSKRDGEQAILNSGCQHLIFRTSWVYGAKGSNFIKTILRIAGERQSLAIVSDQIGVPTSAKLLAELSARAIEQCLSTPEKGGIYHVAPKGETSWYEFAGFIIEEARKLGGVFAVQEILPVSSSDYVTPAKRPQNSRLNTSKVEKIFSIQLPDWQAGVVQVLQETVGTSQ